VTADFDKAAFARVVRAVAPYAADLVFVGGWAQRLFRLHPLASGATAGPLMTLDADIAAPLGLPSRGRTIRQLLLDGGFVEIPSGTDRPPKTRYRLDDASGVHVEFITPLVGGALRRDGTPNATATIQGVSAERLRHVELLLARPWTVELTSSDGYAVGRRPVPVRICNPVSYLTQKLLALPSRRRLQQGKDILYIHDTLLLFGAALEDLRAIWLAEIRPALARKARRQVVGSAEELFGAVTDQSREAVHVAHGMERTVRASDLAAVCRRGLSEIFVT
jgi:hypothetical protein